MATVKLILRICSILFLLGQLAHAQSSHAPDVWKFTCHPVQTFDAIGDVDFDAKRKANYTDPEFMAIVARNMGRAGCFEGTTLSDKFVKSFVGAGEMSAAEAARRFPDSLIKDLEKYYMEAHQAYAQMGFAAPARVRPTGHLKEIGRDINILFLGESSGYMKAHGCSGDNISTMAAPISISGNTYDVWKQGGKAPFYLTAVHELGHLHQFDRWQFLLEGHCDGPHKWIGEGIPDHVAIKAVNSKFGKDYHGPYDNKYFKRFFLTRPYYVPLNLQPKGKQYAYASSRLLGYRTNGFWDFVTRRYLKDKPGTYDDLYTTFSKSNLGNQTAKIDSWLDSKDGGANKGLEHVYPQFLAAMSNWPEHRFQQKMAQKKWDAITFEGCRNVAVQPGKTATLNLNLDRYAGRCFEITLQGFKGKGIPEASLHIEAMAKPDEINELYLGWSKTTGTQNADGDCYQLLEKEGAANSPCLLSPNQGKSKIHPGQQAGRYWSTDKLVFNSEAKVKFILSRIPAKHIDVGSKRNKKDITLNFGTSYASVTKQGQKKNAAVGVGRTSGAAGGMHAPTPVKGQDMGVAGGMASIGMGMMQEALMGRLGIELPNPAANELLHGLSRLEITEDMVGYADDDTGPTQGVLMIFRQAIPFGQTGKFPAHAAEMDIPPGMMILQDDKKPSEVTITRYDREALMLSGTANLCKAGIAELQAAAEKLPPGQDVDMCEVGEPVTVSFEGNMAFGALAIGNNAMEEIRTPEYEAYKGLRVARIQSRFQQMGMPDLLQGNSPTPSEQDVNDDADNKIEGDGINVPPACDCSCEGLKKLEALEEEDIDPANMGAMMQMAQCAMTCMMQYAQCDG